MKLIFLPVILLSLVSCHHTIPDSVTVIPPQVKIAPSIPVATLTPPVTKPSSARITSEQCAKIYTRIITIKTLEIVDGKDAPDEAVRAIAERIDGIYEENGVKEGFFSTCLLSFNEEQVACMTEAFTMDAMTLCENMFEGK